MKVFLGIMVCTSVLSVFIFAGTPGNFVLLITAWIVRIYALFFKVELQLMWHVHNWHRYIGILLLVSCSPLCYTASYSAKLPLKWQEARGGHPAWTFCGGWQRVTYVTKDVCEKRLFSIKGKYINTFLWWHSLRRMLEPEREHYIMNVGTWERHYIMNVGTWERESII